MLKQKIKSIAKNVKFRLSKIPTKIWIIVIMLIVVIGYILCFVVPKDIAFAYAESKYCVGGVTLLPELHKQSGGTTFRLQVEGGVKIGNLYLFSNKICIEPIVSPTVGKTEIGYSPFGGPIFRSKYAITVGPRPILNVKLDQPVALAKPLEFTLNQTDNVFAYQIEIDKKTSACKNKSNKISCDLMQLSLTQGKKYSYKLTRTFNKTDASDAIAGELTLLSPTSVTNTSIKAGEIVYAKPKTFTFETDKKLVTADVTLDKIENDKPIKVDSTSKITGSTIETSISSDLERNTKYRLTLDKAESEDGSLLNASYITDFQTSGGPVVTGVNIGSSGIDANAKVVVTLDQSISQTQDISKLVSLVGGNAVVSRTDNQIIFQLQNLPHCGLFSLKISKGLNSQYDIASKDDWSYTSRINCRTTEVIGYSVMGRPIIAYYYGNGPTTILFTGGIHGTEQSGKYIMQDWIANLDSTAYKIPADKKIVIIPAVNPDGLAASTRYNANNVNLDRNFPSANWATDIDNGSGIDIGGGGASPMSEPETKALANLTTRLQPRLEVSFHAQGSLVGANQYGDSTAIGNLYAANVGYGSMIGHAEATMGYSITGEYEDWAGQQYGTPAILIELPTLTGRYFWAHQSTLWKMVNI
jgi:protein MpaA